MRANNTSISDHIRPICLLSLVVAILNSCILSPVYIQIENNVTFVYTPLPIVLDYVIDLFDLLYISLLFASVSCSVYLTNREQSKKAPIALVLASIVACKHILNLAASSIIDSYIDLGFDIPATLIQIIADLIVLWIVAVIAEHLSKRHFLHAKAMLKASKYIETIEYNEMDDIFPFKGFFCIKGHPILLPIFVGAAITAGLFIIQRLYADIFVLSAPTSFAEIIDIIFSYATDIVYGIIAYAVSFLAAKLILLNSQNK